MKIPHWVMAPFYLFAQFRYLAPIWISLTLLWNFWKTGDVQRDNKYFLDLAVLVFFLFNFSLKFIFDATRETWEANKKSYKSHIWRHARLWMLLFLLLFYSVITIANYHLVNAAIGMLFFETVLIVRHLLDPEYYKKDSLAPSRPI